MIGGPRLHPFPPSSGKNCLGAGKLVAACLHGPRHLLNDLPINEVIVVVVGRDYQPCKGQIPAYIVRKQERELGRARKPAHASKSNGLIHNTRSIGGRGARQELDPFGHESRRPLAHNAGGVKTAINASNEPAPASLDPQSGHRRVGLAGKEIKSLGRSEPEARTSFK